MLTYVIHSPHCRSPRHHHITFPNTFPQKWVQSPGSADGFKARLLKISYPTRVPSKLAYLSTVNLTLKQPFLQGLLQGPYLLSPFPAYILTLCGQTKQTERKRTMGNIDDTFGETLPRCMYIVA
jgi:hypothetical protein